VFKRADCFYIKETYSTGNARSSEAFAYAFPGISKPAQTNIQQILTELAQDINATLQARGAGLCSL
jgi:hypothetical protein